MSDKYRAEMEQVAELKVAGFWDAGRLIGAIQDAGYIVSQDLNNNLKFTINEKRP